jgi:DNA-binding transcriptional LysR family regulator
MLNASQLARVDLNLLVLFHVVLEEGNVGRAAVRLRLTSSAVSHGLTRLRRLLDDRLFLRTPKGIVPTARATALREPVAEILLLVQGVLHTAVPFDAATSKRRFIVGAPDAVFASTAVMFLERIATISPGVVVILVNLMPRPGDRRAEHPWAQCLTQIEQREVDVALLPVRDLPRRFEAHRLYEEDFVVAMRRGHAFAGPPADRRTGPGSRCPAEFAGFQCLPDESFYSSSYVATILAKKAGHAAFDLPDGSVPRIEYRDNVCDWLIAMELAVEPVLDPVLDAYLFSVDRALHRALAGWQQSGSRLLADMHSEQCHLETWVMQAGLVGRHSPRRWARESLCPLACS